MIQLTRRTTLLAISSLTLARMSRAATVRYDLDQAASHVGFRFSLNGIAQAGSMPVLLADVRVDPQDLAASQVDVTLDVRQARTGLILATQALTSRDVLDAKRFPTIRFVSQSIQLAANGRLSDGARINGALTIRGITRQISLNANLYRRRNSASDDLKNLIVQLSGQISRAAFGASGYREMVDDTVILDITAAIRARE